MPLYLSEADITTLLTAADAVPVIENCFLRMAAGEVANMSRRRLPLEGGALAVMGAADSGAGAMSNGRRARGDAPGMIRTCDLCLRRAALYPLSYGRRDA